MLNYKYYLNNKEILEQLINKMSDINIQNPYSGDTALILATKLNIDHAILNMLIEAGGDLNIANNIGETAKTILYKQNKSICILY